MSSSSSSSSGHSSSGHSSGGPSSSVQSNAVQSQNSTNSNQRLAQTAVQGGATAAGAALGGATGAKIGSKVGSAVNNSKVGQRLTNGVGNAMNNINKLNPTNKVAQNLGNKLTNKDSDTNNASGSGSSTPPPIVPTTPTSPSTLGQGLVPSANTFNKNNVPKDRNEKSKVPSKNSAEPKNINKDSYRPWQNSKNPSRNRRPMSQQNSYDEETFEDQLGAENQEEQNDAGKENNNDNKNNDKVIKTPFSGNKKSNVTGKAVANIFLKIILPILPILLPIILVIFIIMLVVMIATSLRNEENGVACVNTPQCDTVIIEDGISAGTYTLDEYLVGAVNNYFREYDGNHVYAAATVIIHKDLMYNAKIDPANKACTLTKNNHYTELKTIDMSSATDDSSVPDSSSDEEEKISDTLDEIDKKIIAAAGAYKNKTIIMYNNISFDEADKSILSGQNANYQKVIKEFLRIEDDSFEVVKICGMDKDQVVNYCSNVEITNGDYAGVYQFEDYVAGVVAAEVGGFNDDEVYKAFAVAARSYLLTHTNENNGTCSIENSTNFQVFRPTTNQKIIDAVTATAGEILYQDGNVVSTQYDAFCWSSKDDNYYTLKQNNQKIPVDWVEQNVSSIYKNYVCNTGTNKGHGNGMSQYGSYYLASVQGYTYDKMLTYYYRGNISSGNTSSGGNSAPEIISGVTANAAGFVMPLQSYSYVSCEFGAPPGIGYKPHRGTDFAAAGGTPIIAVHDGTITNRQYHNSWGNYIKIQNSDGTATLYAHMSAFKEGLSVGSAVKAGQVIGYVGSTGDSTGNHLHLEMYNTSGQLVNPRSYLAF